MKTVSETPPTTPAPAPQRSAVFGFRFALIYGGLAAVAVIAGVALVVVLQQPSKPKPPPWSTWRPTSGSVTTMTKEIADHIAPKYKATGKGTQLVAVIPGSPEITKGTKETKVSTIGFLASASAQCCNRVISTKGNIQAQFCGLGTECSISAGKSTAPRERLVRREALEMALYTFKYVPGVNAVIAYLPPPAGQNPTSLLYLERSNLSKELHQPLKLTLPLDKPPLPAEQDAKEKATIDRLTLPVLYSFQVQALQDGTEALVLTPAAS